MRRKIAHNRCQTCHPHTKRITEKSRAKKTVTTIKRPLVTWLRLGTLFNLRTRGNTFTQQKPLFLVCVIKLPCCPVPHKVHEPGPKYQAAHARCPPTRLFSEERAAVWPAARARVPPANLTAARQRTEFIATAGAPFHRVALLRF